MNKKLTGIVAGAAGAALLLAGSTYALWSDSADVDGGTITAGNLDVDLVASNWHDASDDRTDSPHPIDLTTFKIIPGDTIVGSYELDAGLAGDNMLAALALTGTGLSGDLAAGLTIAYSVEDAAGNEIATGTAADGGVEVALASLDNANAAATATVPVAVDGAADLTLNVSVTFDEATSGQDLVTTTAALSSAGVELAQVRTGAGFN